jgi:hypothetical protein
MSTLNVSNITDGTTTVGTSYVVNGSAKAWINFDGTGTPAARDSENIASITDNGTGNYTLNFTSDMANGNYNATTNARLWSLASDEYRVTTVRTFAAGSIQVETLEPYLGGGSADLRIVDSDINCVSVLGSLA